MAEDFVPPPPSSEGPSVSPIQVGGVLAAENVPVPELNFEPLRQGPSGLVSTGGAGQKQSVVGDVVKAYLNDDSVYKKDIAPYTKVGTYDADYTGTNFARYYNTPRVYKHLGFSPFRDNESLYNKNMTWWDGFKRSVGQSLNMASLSFNGMLPWNAWDGELADVNNAEKMNRASAIGNDTRGTAGAWVNNQILNFGFTAGILGEFAAEEAVLFGVGFIPGMQEVAAGGMYANVSKFLANFNKYRKAVKVSAESIKGYRELSTMRKIWKAAQETKLISKTFLPGTYEAVRDVYRAGAKGRPLGTLAAASRTFGGFYRDTREMAAALSESKLEAGSVENDVYRKLVDDYYNKYGRLPGYEDAEAIRQHAEDAGRETFLWNLPVIYGSNKIVFEKAIRGWIPNRILRSEASQTLGGKFVKDYKWFKTPGARPWQYIPKMSPMAAAKTLFKPKSWNVSNLSKDFLGTIFHYTKANLTEGLQEVYQEAVAPAMTDYFITKYNNPQAWATKSMWGEFYDKGKSLVNSEAGASVFASGFLMGGLIQMPQSLIFDYGRDLAWRVGKPEEYKEYKKMQTEKAEKVVNALNYITETRPNEFMSRKTMNGAAQMNLDGAADIANQEGDLNGYKDIVNDQMFEHIHSMIESGHEELLQEQLDDMDNLSDDELIEAHGEVDPSKLKDGETSAQYYRRKIQSFKDDVDVIKKTYDSVEESIVDPYDYNMIDKEKHPQEWLDTFFNHQAMKEYKKMLVAGRYHYGKTIDRMVGINDQFAKTEGFKGIPATELNILFSSNIDTEAAVDINTGRIKMGSLAGEINQLNLDINALEKMEVPTPESKKSLSLKKERVKLLESFSENLSYWLSAHKDYETARRTKADNIDKKEEAVEATLQAFKRAYEKYILFTAKQNGVNMDTISTFKIQDERLSEEGRKIVEKEVRSLQRLLRKEDTTNPRMRVVDAIQNDIETLLSETPEDYFEKLLERARANNDEQLIEDLESKIEEIKDKSPKVIGEKVSGIYLSEERELSANMEEAFMDLVDFYKLTNDKNQLIEAINVLHNPYMIAAQGEVMANVMKANYENRQALFRKMWETFKQNLDKNMILSKLSEINVFFDPKYIDEFLAGRLDNVVFFKYDGKNIMEVSELREPDKTNTENQINEILDTYLRAEGKDITGRPITGSTPETQFNVKSREKVPNDKRTYDDLAKQFGFDPKASQTEVNAKKVLQMIIDSEYAIPQERLLAKRFMNVIGDLHVVKFRNNHPTPGSYSSTEGVVVDARYSSHDYKGGVTPFEHVILHEIGHLLTVEEYDTDPQFKAAIQTMLNVAKDFHAKNTSAYKPLYGLKDEYEFIAEALSSPTFQAYLNTIDYTPTGKTLWTEFLDALSDFITKLFGIPRKSSLLDEALYVITTKIGGPEVGGPAATTPGGPIISGGPAATTALPVKSVKLLNNDSAIGSAKNEKLGMFFEGLELHHDLQTQPEVYKMLVDKLGQANVDLLKGKVFAKNGQWMFNHGGDRLVMFMHVGNGVVPVYFSSSGTSGKALTWHPFFGIDADTGWIFKQMYYPDRKVTQLDDYLWSSNPNYKDALPLMNEMLSNLDSNLNIQPFKSELLKTIPKADLEGAPNGFFRGQNLELTRDRDGVTITPHAENNIAAILTSILKDNILGRTEGATTPAPVARYINQFSSIDDLKPVLPELLRMYTDSEAQRSREGLPNLNPGYEMMTDNQIVNSEGFRLFLSQSSAIDLMTDYNMKNKTMPESMLESMRTTPTPEQRKYMKENLFYTDEQINKLSYAEAQLYINEGVRGDLEEQRKKKLKELEEEAERNFIKDFRDSYDAIDPMDEDAREKLFAWYDGVRNPARMAVYIKHGITSEVWGPMFEEKLAKIKQVEPLKIGEFYILDGKLYKMIGTKDMKYRLVPYEQLALPESDRTEVKIDFKDLNKRNIKPAPRPKDAQAPAAPVVSNLSSTTVFDIKNGLNQQQARQAIIDFIDKFGQLGLLNKEDVEYYKTRIVRFGEKFGAEFNARDAINQYAKDKNVRLSEEEIGNLAQQIKTAYEVAMGIKPSIAPALVTGVQGTIEFEPELTPEENDTIGSQPNDNTVDNVDLKSAHDNATDNADDIFAKEDPDACL